MTDTKQKLIADCKFIAEELENVGVKKIPTCGQCANFRLDGGHGYCTAKSDYADADNDVIETHYEVYSDDEITEHGDWVRPDRALCKVD